MTFVVVWLLLTSQVFFVDVIVSQGDLGKTAFSSSLLSGKRFPLPLIRQLSSPRGHIFFSMGQIPPPPHFPRLPFFLRIEGVFFLRLGTTPLHPPPDPRPRYRRASKVNDNPALHLASPTHHDRHGNAPVFLELVEDARSKLHRLRGEGQRECAYRTLVTAVLSIIQVMIPPPHLRSAPYENPDRWQDTRRNASCRWGKNRTLISCNRQNRF